MVTYAVIASPTSETCLNNRYCPELEKKDILKLLKVVDFASAFLGEAILRRARKLSTSARRKAWKVILLSYLADVKFWCRDPGRLCAGLGHNLICKKNKMAEPIVRDLWDPTNMTSTKTDLKKRSILLTA